MTGGFTGAGLADVHAAITLARHLSPDSLAHDLYALWYAPPADPDVPLDVEAPSLSGVFRAAHAGSTRQWQPAVIVHRGLAGVVVVRERSGALRAVTRGEYVSLENEHDVLVSAVRSLAAGGWWRTWSDTWDASTPPTELSRLYLAPDRSEAIAIVRAVTALLPDGRPWLLKAGLDAVTLARPDGVVLYVPDHALTGELVADVTRATAPHVRRARPRLACPAAPGVSWAQSPVGEESFGETICQLLAEVLATRPAEPVRAVERAFAAAGLDPARPHLRAAVRRKMSA